MIYFPMRNGIRMIRVEYSTITKRSLCADAARKLRIEQNWSERALRLYSAQGIIEASR